MSSHNPRFLIRLRDSMLELSLLECLKECSQASLAPPGQDLLAAVRDEGASALIVDLSFLSGAPDEFLAWLRQGRRRCAVVVAADGEHRELALSALEAGAEHFVALPSDGRELQILARRLAARRDPPEEAGQDPEDGGSEASVRLGSASMTLVYERVAQVAPRERVNVLISGETGVGKYNIARLIHLQSGRNLQPFLDIDCAAIPAALLESELFGYEAGAYTDARKRKAGLLELAGRGTVFLDEIGELPLELQVKLLKTLEQRRYRRLGGTDTVQLEARIVSASNRDLELEVRRGRFRADLYYRLCGFLVHVPPLRERHEDLMDLAGFFYGQAGRAFGKRLMPLTGAALEALKGYSWPGNIRELKNLVEGIVITTPVDQTPSAEAVRAELARSSFFPMEAGISAAAPAGEEALLTKRESEEKMLRLALQRTQGNKAAAAKLLGISKPTLFRKIKAFGI